jgi:hypothetical protein
MQKRSNILVALGMLCCSTGVAIAQSRHTLLPDYVNIQHAGSVGWLSVGIDYDLFKGKGRLGGRFGTVPKSLGGPLQLVSTSLFYVPLTVPLSSRLVLNPVDVGFKMSYHFGEQFYTALPSRYPEGYYWWKSALRFHLATQTALTWKLRDPNKIKSVTGYVELNTNELYLVSYIQNARTLRPSEIIKAGIGVRLKF